MDWQLATLVKKEQMAVDVTSLTFSLSQWQPHRAGQYYELRRKGEAADNAPRAYSVATSPSEKGVVEFGVQFIEGGALSPYLVSLAPGDEIEAQGPHGGHFVWDPKFPEPLIVIGGGSGVVPLLSIIRHHRESRHESEAIIIVSAKTRAHLIGENEFAAYARENPHVSFHATLTREAPAEWKGLTGRLNAAALRTLITIRKKPRIYIAGPTTFVDAIRKDLILIGFDSSLIRTEQFGGTIYE